MTEIVVNGEALDLFTNEEIVVSFEVNNLFSIENRNGSYSNTFKIPATSRNNLILEINNNILSTSDIPYENVPVEIYTDGILQVKGYFNLVSATKFEYEMQIYGTNANLFANIQDRSLQSLLVGCEYSQYWNISTTISSRSNVWTDVYIYPNIDYGELFFLAGSNVDFSKLYPAIYVKYLFKRIFDILGLIIDSEWYDNDPLLEKMIIPWSALWQRDKNYSLRNNFIYTLGTDVSNNNPGFVPINFHTNTNHILDTPCFNFRLGDTLSIPTTPFFLSPTRQIASSFCTLDGGKLTIDYNITYETDTLAPPAATTTQILVDYVDKDGNTQLFNIIPVVSGIQPLTNIVGSFTLDIGRGAVRINLQQCKIYAGSTLEFNIVPSEEDSGDLEINFAFNFITLGGTLPDIQLTDFLLTLCNQFGLTFQQEQTSNVVKIFKYEKLITNIPIANDWSDKLDIEQVPVINFISKEYFRNNYFRYVGDDQDEYLMRLGNYGEGNIVVNSAPTGTQQELFLSVFAATIRLNSYSGTIPLAWIPCFDGPVFTQVQPRIAYIEQDTSALLTIQPGGFFTPVQPNVYFDDLVFQNLLTENYPQLSLIINKGKSITCLLRLSNIDINKLDFSLPIWIDYFNAYFYINEIQQYKVTSKDSTQVVLILISN
jgi:hypothetical protein